MRHRRATSWAVLALVITLSTGGCASGSPPGAPASSAQGYAFPTGFALEPAEGFDATGDFEPDSTCDGNGDLSPGLAFSNVPSSAELAVSMVDLDNRRVHWLQVSIPATVDGLVQHQLIAGAVELTNDFGEPTYDGPCPPAGARHRYQLTLYALPRAFVPPAQGSPTQVLAALVAQTAESATFTAAYTRR